MAALSKSSLHMLVDKNLAGDICVGQILKADCIFCLFCICIKVRIISTVFRGLVQLANTWNSKNWNSATLTLNLGKGEQQPVSHSLCSMDHAPHRLPDSPRKKGWHCCLPSEKSEELN